MKEILKKAKIKVTYCGGWGYGYHFNNFKKDMSKFFPNIDFEGDREPKTTGNFIVYVDGKKIFSKKEE